MIEQHIAWSETLGQYRGGECDCLEDCESRCKRFSGGGVTDWRPVRIPPPSEIEANARDAERLEWLESQVNATFAAGWQLLDVTIPGDNLRAAIDAAMKGGE